MPNGGAGRAGIRRTRAIPALALSNAAEPAGGMAFVASVAAFGQKLRGDKCLGEYAYADLRKLAGDQGNFWRQQYVKLTELADRR